MGKLRKGKGNDMRTKDEFGSRLREGEGINTSTTSVLGQYL